MTPFDELAYIRVVGGPGLGLARVVWTVFDSGLTAGWSGQIVSWEKEDKTATAHASQTGVELFVEGLGSGHAQVETDGDFMGSGDPPGS